MNRMSKSLIAAVPAIVAAAIVGHSQAATIFEDNFDEFNGVDTTGQNLNGLTPDTTTGSVAWEAASIFKSDGSFTGNTGGATLAFTPSQGNEYTLDISFGTVTGGSWVAFGFANANAATTGLGNDYRFTSETAQVLEGRAWGLVRTAGNGNTNNTFLKGSQGDAAAAAWENLTNQDGPVDVRVILDTTLGAGNWTTTMYARTGTNAYSVIRSESNLSFEDINRVGFATASSTSSVSYFNLSAIPEPSTALLGAFGSPLLFRRRRS